MHEKLLTPRSVAALAQAIFMLAPVTAGAIVAGQVDDFEDGTTQGWQEGATSPNPPTNEPTGGPNGSGDSYLQNVASGAGTAGSRLVQFNKAQWTGNYTAGGITAIFFRARVFSGPDLTLRVGFRSSDDAAQKGWVSASSADLPADGEWHDIVLPVSASDLVSDGSVLTYGQTMADVDQMRIFHSTTANFSNVDQVAATAGFDLITALPVATYSGWLWSTSSSGFPPFSLEEDYCFGPIGLLIDNGGNFIASGDEICWGRMTTNANPARSYYNFDGVTFPSVDSFSTNSTRPLVSAGGNLSEAFAFDEETMGEDRVATVLSEPDGGDLLILGGALRLSFESEAFVHLLASASEDAIASRTADQLLGRWRLPFFSHALSEFNVNAEFAASSIRTVDFEAAGQCSFVESDVFQEPAYDANGESFVVVQVDAAPPDLTNRGVNAVINDAVFSACTYTIDGDGYLSMSYTSTTTGGATPVNLRFVVADDNNYLVPAPDSAGLDESPASLAFGYRAPTALGVNQIDGNYLFYLVDVGFQSTGSGHSSGKTGTQEFDFRGRGMLTFNSAQAGIAPEGLGGAWFACAIDLVQDGAEYQVDGDQTLLEVTTAIDVDAERVPITACDYSVSADGSLLINIEVTDPAEPAEDVLLAGYVNDNGDVLSIVNFESDPVPGDGFEDSGAVRQVIAIRYTGNPNANADGDDYFNLEEFQLPVPDAEPLTKLVSLPDVTSDSIEDIGVVRAGSALAEIRSGANGALQRVLTYFGNDFTPLTAAALPDADGNGVAELAVLATRDADGRIAVEIRNLSGAEAPRTVYFAPDHTPVAMTVIDGDADDNGVPELAVLSRRNSDGRGLVEVKNAFGPTNPRALWAGAGLTASDVEVVPDADANGVPEVAILSTRDADGRIVAEIKNAAGPTLPSAVWFAPGHTAIDLTVVPDKDSNGVPEVALLSSRDADGRILVEIKNAAGATQPSAVWFAPGHTALEVAAVNDADSNGVPEVAVLSTRDADGRILVEVKNAAGATNPNPVWYSAGFTARDLATIADTDSNGIDEALVLMIRDADGRILVQGRNTAGNPVPNNYWFSP